MLQIGLRTYGGKKHMRKPVGLIIFLLLIGCATTPVTHRRQMILVSSEQMSQLGEQAFQEILAKEKPFKNPQIEHTVDNVVRRLATASDSKKDWQYALFASADQNAFCLPGGKIGIFAGILPVALNNAGLAAVLGHEIGHVLAHHPAERMSQGLVVQGVMIGADIATQSEKNRSMILGALGVGAQFGVMLPFSRKQEKEADLIGMMLMARAGYDPEEAIKVWERMDKEPNRIPEFLSTHPQPKSRIKNLRKHMSEAKREYDAQKDKQATKNLPMAELAATE